MFLTVFFLIAGLALVVKGADWLVEGASTLARRIGASELAIGLTVVAFGTSMPELTVNVVSALNGTTDIAIGNILGSNTANILLILGVCGLIAPLSVQNSTVWKEIPLALLAALAVLVMANDAFLDGAASSVISRGDGIILIGFFLVFLWYTFGLQSVGDEEHKKDTRSLPMACLMILGGLGLLIAGGKLTVAGAVGLATAIGLSEAFIGLTVVAVGTSVPELATSVVAARRGKADIAVGNIVGSNIFNIFWIMGVSAILQPLPFRPEFNIDVWAVIVATIILFYCVHNGHIGRRLLFWRQRKGFNIRRIDGILMLVLYVTYVAYLAWRG